jgi:hypothetical protein
MLDLKIPISYGQNNEKGMRYRHKTPFFLKPGGWRCNRNSWQLASLATLPTDLLPWF